jgi:hypothetical protein
VSGERAPKSWALGTFPDSAALLLQPANPWRLRSEEGGFLRLALAPAVRTLTDIECDKAHDERDPGGPAGGGWL